MIELILPDGRHITSNAVDTPINEILKKEGIKWKRSVVCAKSSGSLIDLSEAPKDNSSVELLSPQSPEGIDVIRHSASHILADAVKRLYPEAKLAIGPSIENGFYYDFDVDTTFTPEDLKTIEKEMKRIIKSNIRFNRSTLSKEEAIKKFEDKGQIYKVELINEIEDKEVSIYTHGDFIDLCRGPHIYSTGLIPSFKLMKVTGAYWRGNENNKMLQRIYGTAFPSQKELDDYLKLLEDLKKRDHRRLGKDLDLYSIHQEAGAGLVYWHPKGGLIRVLLEEFWRKEHLKHGYEMVFTPHIARDTLWQESGHSSFFKENMFSPMDVDGSPFYAKPMNCPGHILIYKSGVRSYRDLPIRWAELGTVYRYERSGVLHGLLRVRGFTQDDAHIFTTLEKLNSEILRTVKFAFHILGAFKFNEILVSLGTMPKDHIGSEEIWETATRDLKNALKDMDVEYEVEEEGGAFYGPKIDLKIKDSLGRLWQCSTIQVDFNLPERFKLKYRDKDGVEKRPIMIHRALLGSLERFFGILIEHFAGNFPLWLAPTQVIILPISENNKQYAEKIKEKLEEKDIRAKIDNRNERISLKVRDFATQKIPYALIVGEEEENENVVSIRKRIKGDIGKLNISEFSSMILDEIQNKI